MKENKPSCYKTIDEWKKLKQDLIMISIGIITMLNLLEL